MVLIALALAPALTACAPWPQASNGGMAERYPTQWVPVLIIQDRYEELQRIGAVRFYAGRMTEAHELIVRATREHEGGLVEDGAQTLIKIDVLLTGIETDMHRSKAAIRPRLRS